MDTKSMGSIYIRTIIIVVMGISATGSAFCVSTIVMPSAMAQMPPTQNRISIVLGASDPNSKEFYVPSVLRVAVGSTVVWINNDNSPHTATSTTSVFDSNIIQPRGTFSSSFNIQGIFDYYCTIHPFMNGEIRVG